MSILWTCLPAAALVALGAYFKTVDYQTRFLAPFSALYNVEHFSRGMTTTYTDELVPVTAYKAFRERDWAVVLAKGAAVLAALSPILLCRLYTAEEVRWETEVDMKQVDWFKGSAEPVLVDLEDNNVSLPWIHDDLVFPKVEIAGDTRHATIKTRLRAAKAELTCKPLEPAGGNLTAVECEPLDTEKSIMCDADAANEFFGHAATKCTLPSTGEEFPGFMHYLWGSCEEGVAMDRKIVSCDERVVGVEVETTLRGEDLSIVGAEQDEDSKEDLDIRLPREKVYDLRLETDPWYDAFFTLVSRDTSLGPDTAPSTITSAIEAQHARLRAQTLTASRTPSASHRKGTKTEPTTRVVQHRVQTYLLAVALTLALAFSAAGGIVMPARVLPCSPGSIGAVAGMLAEWGMRVVPAGAEWMGDKALRRFFEGR